MHFVAHMTFWLLFLALSPLVFLATFWYFTKSFRFHKNKIKQKRVSQNSYLIKILAENCTKKIWKFVTPQLMIFLYGWFFAGIRWGGSNRESWRTSRGEHADERIRKSHLQVLRSFGIKWDFKWGTSASSSKKF